MKALCGRSQHHFHWHCSLSYASGCTSLPLYVTCGVSPAARRDPTLLAARREQHSPNGSDRGSVQYVGRSPVTTSMQGFLPWWGLDAPFHLHVDAVSCT